MKYEITAEQLAELERVIVAMPYQHVKPYEAKVGQLIEKIKSQEIKKK